MAPSSAGNCRPAICAGRACSRVGRVWWDERWPLPLPPSYFFSHMYLFRSSPPFRFPRLYPPRPGRARRSLPLCSRASRTVTHSLYTNILTSLRSFHPAVATTHILHSHDTDTLYEPPRIFVSCYLLYTTAPCSIILHRSYIGQLGRSLFLGLHSRAPHRIAG